MRKVIAAFNMTLDGFCDHTALTPDEEIHDHYTQLLGQGDAILYGRITYDLMKFWIPLVKNPTGEQSMDGFAQAIDKIPKIVFSHTLKETDPMAIGWDSATLSDQPLKEKVIQLKQQSGKDIFVGSRSLIVQLANLHLIDEYQLCVLPVILGKGLPLFDKINDRTLLKLLNTKVYPSGAVIMYYQRASAEAQ